MCAELAQPLTLCLQCAELYSLNPMRGKDVLMPNSAQVLSITYSRVSPAVSQTNTLISVSDDELYLWQMGSLASALLPSDLSFYSSGTPMTHRHPN